LYHFDISPATILIEKARGRAMLTGFQIPPPASVLDKGSTLRRHRTTTQKLATSPYLPVKDRPEAYDQRTSIYMLAATMHHALTNYPPQPYPPDRPLLPVSILNAAISAELEAILSRALMEDCRDRYQSYAEMRRDIQRLL